jgi:hypothetical protein
MGIHSRVTPVLALVAALAVGGTSAARAQDTTAATGTDTAGYRGYQADTSQTGQGVRTDTSGYTGATTDTALKAKPGVQTGPSAADSMSPDSGMADTGQAVRQASRSGVADSVVCKDGSNAANASNACAQHGGIDWTSTQAAMKARGHSTGYRPDTATGGGQNANSSNANPSADSAKGGTSDTSQTTKNGANGYRYNGASSDTALRAKPGTQTGPDTGAAGKTDTSSSGQQSP